MMRYLLFTIFIFVLYYAIRSMVRAAISAARRDEHDSKLPGDEMVLDPECRTYVVKRRAIPRRVNGTLFYFCSEACADHYEQKGRARLRT